MASPNDFFAQMLPHAKRVSERTGLDPRLILAQTALETGYGKSAPNNNYFGIKSHGKSGGADLVTQEFEGGRMVTKKQNFRGYQSPGDSFDGYGEFLLQNPRYQSVLGAQGLEAQITAMGASGYATDPAYGIKLANIAKKIDIEGLEPYAPKLPEGLEVPSAAPAPTFRTTAEDQALQKALDDAASEVGFLEGVQAAYRSEWVGSWALAQMGREDFIPDMGFNYTEETWAEITDGLPEAYHEYLEGAVSPAHAKFLRQRALEMAENDAKLGAFGGWGTVMRIGATIIDPVAIGMAVATDGVLAPVIALQKAGKVGRALRLGMSAGVSNAAIEAYMASQDPTRGIYDVLLAGATGLALGGALGGILHRNPALKEMDDELAKIGRSVQNELLLDRPDGNLGAARVSGADDLKNLTAAERQLAQHADSPFSAMGKVRVDTVGRGKQSQHPLIRALFGFFAEDAVGNKDGSALVRAASENVALELRTRMSAFYRTAEPAYKDWLRDQGAPLWARWSKRDEFFEEVGRAVRRQDGFYTQDPHVNRVANEMRKMQNDLLQYAREKNIKGFDWVKDNPEYLMRVFNHRRLDKLTKQLGPENLNRMVANAIVKGSRGIEYEDALDIAEAYLKSIRSQKYQDLQLSRVFSDDQADMLEELLMEAGGLSAERINSIVSNVRKPQSGPKIEGDMSRAKRRLQLDETHKEVFTTRDGQQISVGMEDFLDNNAERLMNLYTRQMVGAGEMEAALSNFKVPRADGEVDVHAPSFETVKQHIRDTAHLYDMHPKKLEAELGKLDVLYKAIMGIPLSPQTMGSETMRWLRRYNLPRVLAQVGMAQISETGNILGAGGWRVTLQNVPALRGIYRRAQDGKLENELLAEMEAVIGIGTERQRRSFTSRMDDYGIYEGSGAVGSRADKAMKVVENLTMDISFMAPINMALHRMSALAVSQRWFNDALGKSAIPKDRLAVMGLEDSMVQRIHQQMREHAITEKGWLGPKVKRFDLDTWTDQEAAQSFVHAIDRWTKKIIQENDIGNLPKWMTADWGKTLMQFRSFQTVAWSKQLLSGMHHRDWMTFSSFMWTTFFGGLSYTAQTYANSIGREDQQKFLAERLNPSALGRAAFQRAAYSSFIPGAVDTLTYLLGHDPMFAFGRSSGLSTDYIVGNPTLDLITKGAAATKGFISPFTKPGYRYSQEDWKALTSLLPWQNAFVIRNGLHVIGQELPERSERR